MQNKGVVKLFAILFGLVSIYQLSFTFKNSAIEKEAKEYAISKFDTTDEINASEARYLDSISNEPVFDLGFSEFTFNDVKDKAMNLGLDLKGGINVILQISVKDILSGLANKSKDPVFNQALNDADELQKDSQDTYLESFYEAWDAIKGDSKLASPDIFANRNLSEEINFEMSDDQVKPIIEQKIDESILSAFEVLRKRIDKFGVTSPNIQRMGKTARIAVELPGAKDVERVKSLLQSTAQLEFWDAYKGQEFGQFIYDANEVLKGIVELKKQVDDNIEPDDTESVEDIQDSQIDDLLGETGVDSTAVAANPLLDLIAGAGYQGGPVVAQFRIQDKEVINQYLAMPEVRSLLAADKRYTKFVWGKETPNSELIDLYALIGNRDNTPELSGGVVTDASQTYDPRGRAAVSMQMNSTGAKIWEKMTGEAFNQQSQIAIVLDDIVYSAPGVTSGPISGGNSEITGEFSLAEATDLANVLRAGKLPASADIIQAEEIGASLGQQAVKSGMTSFLIALALVLIWMLFYYGKAGIFADIALLFNILLIFGVLSGLGAVLTLPGIAGIVLTIGMSVDANVLIFERIKEELAKGKGLKEAIKDGFGHALSSILDANITTGLTAIILFIFGTGPIKGFATTLLIGIATSLFTAIFITRLLVDWYANRKGNNRLDFSTSITKNLFTNMNINFLGKRKIAYIVSGIMLVVSLGSLSTQGLDQGIDFVGGREYLVKFSQNISTEEVRSSLEEILGSAEVKTIGSNNKLKIGTNYKIDENSAEADAEVQRLVYNGLQKFLPDGMTYEQFSDSSSNEAGVGRESYGKVGPTIADDIKKASFWAILGSLIVVFLYILFRFKKWQFSLGAVLAVFHDVIIVLGIFSITFKFMPFNMEINQAFIAAILTVIGYSLNDTVVVFDRIREFLNEHTGWELDRTVNGALNSTLSRTLNTSLTTLVVLLAIFTFGGDSLRGFMFALIVGVIVGTYSSVFIATPAMFDSVNKGKKKE